MLRELAEALEALTTTTPLVLVLEDLHWSDMSTVNVLTYLAQRRESARLLLLGTYRPVDVVVREHPLRGVLQELRGRGLCDELPLELLLPEDVGAYVAARLGGEVTAELTALLYHQSEGNALFTTQLFAIAFIVPFHLSQAVAAELFAHRLSQDERNHRFANHSGRGNHRDVRTFETQRALPVSYRYPPSAMRDAASKSVSSGRARESLRRW